MWVTIWGESWEGEFVNRRKSGELFIERAKISPIRQSDGKITQYLANKEDITALKHTEKVLRRSEQNYREIFNATSEAIVSGYARAMRSRGLPFDDQWISESIFNVEGGAGQSDLHIERRRKI